MSDFFADAGAWIDQAVQDTGEWIDQAVQDTGDVITGNSKAPENDPVSDVIEPLTNTYDPITNLNQASEDEFYRRLMRKELDIEQEMIQRHEMYDMSGVLDRYTILEMVELRSMDFREEIFQDDLFNSMAAPSEVLA